ncbi:MAG: DUF4105 domain-containing protein [Zetaproteobacteria bacterium]|nr:DUF4105 domain-containing protein [Zetaproteobacteria bacterium]
MFAMRTKLAVGLSCWIGTTPLIAKHVLLNQDYSPAVDRFVEQALSQLPTPIVELILTEGVKVGFKPLDTHHHEEQTLLPLTCPNPEEDHPDFSTDEQLTYGEYLPRHKRIFLNQKLIGDIQLGESAARSFPCGHRNMYRLALASLYHELMHFLDDHLTEEKLSRQPEFLNISEFRRSPLHNIAFNQEVNSPDPYEYTNSAEKLATNFEFFMLDPEYACRRPLMHMYYTKLLQGFDPFAGQRTCQVFTQFATREDTLEVMDLDPQRVYRIDYALADEGDALYEGFGHTLFRLVMCAPERVEPVTGTHIPATPYGPQCLADQSYHIVASYAGKLDGNLSSLLKVTFASIPASFSLSSLRKVLTRYTVHQRRSLSFYPLELPGEDKVRFLYRMLSHYWNYNGRYNFFSNNCATLALQVIKAASGYLMHHTDYRHRPKSILNFLIQKGVVKSSRPVEVIPADPYIAKALDILYPGKKMSLKHLIKHKWSAATRHQALQNCLQQSTTAPTQQQSEEKLCYSSYLVTESQLLHLQRQKIDKKLQKRLFRQLKQQLKDDSTDEGSFIPPWEYHLQPNRGYGIPLQYDFAAEKETITNLYLQNKESYDSYMTRLQQSKRGQELIATTHNYQQVSETFMLHCKPTTMCRSAS